MAMSLPSMLYSNWWEDLDEPHSLMSQYFGDGLSHEHLHKAHNPTRMAHVPGMFHLRKHGPVARRPVACPWAAVIHNPGASTVKPDKDSFNVSLDVQQFSPEEISVKVIDRCAIVEGKHEDKRDEHGWVARQFCRRYEIPEQCDLDKVQSTLSSDGVLSIIVPRKAASSGGERAIPIVHTGKPAVVDTPKQKKTEETKGADAS